MKTRLGALLLVALSVLAMPAPVAACDPAPGFEFPPPPPDDTPLHYGLAIGGLSALDGTLIALQIAAGSEMFPEWAAALEIAIGSLQVLGAPVVLVLSSFASGADRGCSPRGPSSFDEGAITSGLMLGVGGWILAHGIWSLADVDGSDVHDFAPSVSVTPDGASLRVAGRF